MRYRTGETNRLEQVSAAARAQELQNRLVTLQTQLLVQRRQLGVLLNTGGLPVSIDTTTQLIASLLPAGLGFIPAFIGPKDHRALHDRLADTRVVRA